MARSPRWEVLLASDLLALSGMEYIMARFMLSREIWHERKFFETLDLS